MLTCIWQKRVDNENRRYDSCTCVLYGKGPKLTSITNTLFKRSFGMGTVRARLCRSDLASDVRQVRTNLE